MSFQTPVSMVSTQIGGLGTLDGFHYANGVEQYCGIPYASLSKRWTRSLLRTSWENDYHNGTQLGNNMPRLEGPTFLYRSLYFDQRSRLDNVLNGKAYHGFDVVYLFGNLDNKLNARERVMGRDIASAWIKFAWGQEPRRTDFWEFWGPDSLGKLETEEEDEHVCYYSRFKRLRSWGSGGWALEEISCWTGPFIDEAAQVGIIGMIDAD